MNETRRKRPALDYLMLLAENVRLAAELERVKTEKQRAEDDRNSMTRMAESQALELLQLKQGIAKTRRWKCRINQNASERDLETLLDNGWEITHQQFNDGRLGVVAKMVVHSDPPAPVTNGASIAVLGLDEERPKVRPTREQMNASLRASMQRSYEAAGGGLAFRSIKEMRPKQ